MSNVRFYRIIDNPNYRTRHTPQEVYRDLIGLVIPMLVTGGEYPNATPLSVYLEILSLCEPPRPVAFSHYSSLRRPDGDGWMSKWPAEVSEEVGYEEARKLFDGTRIWQLLREGPEMGARASRDAAHYARIRQSEARDARERELHQARQDAEGKLLLPRKTLVPAGGGRFRYED